MSDARIKRPAYQWYPADANSDEVFRLMSYEQQGIYRALLDHQWLEGSIPFDPVQIGRLLPKMPRTRFLRVWPLISTKFRPSGDRLINDRLESQRRRLEVFCESQAAKGQKGGQKRAANLAAATVRLEPNASSSSSSSTSSSPENEEQCSTPSAEPASPMVLEFSTVGTQGKTWPLTERQLAHWQALYPDLNVLAEARKALAWTQALSGRRKTPRGMPGFLVGWLNRSNDSGRSTTAKPMPATASTVGKRSLVPSHERL